MTENTLSGQELRITLFVVRKHSNGVYDELQRLASV